MNNRDRDRNRFKNWYGDDERGAIVFIMIIQIAQTEFHEPNIL